MLCRVVLCCVLNARAVLTACAVLLCCAAVLCYCAVMYYCVPVLRYAAVLTACIVQTREQRLSRRYCGLTRWLGLHKRVGRFQRSSLNVNTNRRHLLVPVPVFVSYCVRE